MVLAECWRWCVDLAAAAAAAAWEFVTQGMVSRLVVHRNLQ